MVVFIVVIVVIIVDKTVAVAIVVAVAVAIAVAVAVAVAADVAVAVGFYFCLPAIFYRFCFLSFTITGVKGLYYYYIFFKRAYNRMSKYLRRMIRLQGYNDEIL